MPRLPTEQQELQVSLIVGVAAAKDLASALGVMVGDVAHAMGWCFGQAWIPSGGTMHVSDSWTGRAGHEQFRRASEPCTYARGDGLIGQAWATAMPVWIRDVSTDAAFERAEAAAIAGFATGVAIPLLANEAVVAVIEFFMTEPSERDDQKIAVVAAVAKQLGVVIERQREKDALRVSELRFRSVTESAHEAIICTQSDGLISFWNAAATSVFGWSEDQALGQSLRILVPERDRAVLPMQLVRLASGGDVPRCFEIQGRRRDGTEFPLEVSLSAWWDYTTPMFTIIARDISQRRRAEAALREREEQLAITLQCLGEAVICTDVAGRITRMNAAAERLTGWVLADAAGRELGEVVQLASPDQDARLAQGSAARSADQPEAVLVARDGSRCPISQTVSALKDGRGQTTGLVYVLRDLTDEVLVRARQRAMERRLAIADRMSSIGTLASGVAHEINNPLAYMLANLDTIEGTLLHCRDSHTEADEMLSLIAEVREGTHRITSIVRDLKRFARVDDHPRSLIDLRRVLEAAIKLTRNEIRHRARLVVEHEDLPGVSGSESRLQQVFVNLLINAAQAIPEGRAHDNEIRVTTRADIQAQTVYIEIADTGVGIPEHLLPRIFEPFFTTKPIGEGSGLGLSICHGIITSLGGRIEAARSDRVTTFRVTLPIAASRPDVVEPTKPPPPERCAHRILLVEDEATLARSLARTLRRDHAVVVAHGGRDALQRLASECFDVVVSDLMMPEMTGIEFYYQLAQIQPDLARGMIFITGGAFTSQARAFLETVENPCLEKPFEVRELAALIHKQLAPERSGN